MYMHIVIIIVCSKILYCEPDHLFPGTRICMRKGAGEMKEKFGLAKPARFLDTNRNLSEPIRLQHSHD